jgi:hypothetical protein
MSNPLTWLLYALLAAAIVPIILRAVVYFPILVLFGMDAPGTKPLEYLFLVSVPLLAVVAVMVVAGLALRLWYSKDWRLASFAIALALCWGSWFLYLKTGSR